MTNQLKQKQSHRSILDLFPRNLVAQSELTYIYLFLVFLLLPYSSAQPSNRTSSDNLYSVSNTFSASTGIILIVIIGFFFFLGFFSIYIHQCSVTRFDGSIRPDGMDGRTSRRGNRGLDPAVIDTFPTFAYSYVKGHKLGKGALECAVCLSEFEDEDTIRLLPKCDHVFHPECIDVWLSRHKTCPVCRADLVPVPGETSATTASVQDMEDDSDGEIPRLEPVDAENEQVSINVTSDEPQVVAPVVVAPEAINQIPMQNRPPRSTKSRFAGRFPRSNSTGHSLVQPGEDVERFTLRLPEEVRKQIMNMRQLNRTRSMMSLPTLGSSRKGYRNTGEGSSKGYRNTGEGSSRGRSIRGLMGEKTEGWLFSMTPSFLMKAPSPRSSKIRVEGDAPVTPPRPKPFRLPLRMSTAVDSSGPLLTRPPV